jgi:hypothetical protein
MAFYLGLDLGQTQDPSALVVIDAYGSWPERTYDVRHLEVFPLGTSYPAIVDAVSTLLGRSPLVGDCTLVIDHTGVGRPVGEMFAAAQQDYLGITITGGAGWHQDSECRQHWHVAKMLLVSVVQRCLQSGRLRIGKDLPHAKLLQKELRDFRVKITKAANETYESREGSHDDLVLSLAIGLFVAEHGGPPPADVGPADMERIWAEARQAGIGIQGHDSKPAMTPRRFMKRRW